MLLLFSAVLRVHMVFSQCSALHSEPDVREHSIRVAMRPELETYPRLRGYVNISTHLLNFCRCRPYQAFDGMRRIRVQVQFALRAALMRHKVAKENLSHNAEVFGELLGVLFYSALD